MAVMSSIACCLKACGSLRQRCRGCGMKCPLRDQGKEFLGGFPGPFCAEGADLARCQAGRGDGDAEPHRVAVGHEHEGGAARISGDREDGEAASEEGMGRVGYLDLLGRSLGRVVERGIMEGIRSTRSRTPNSSSRSRAGSAIGTSWG